LTKNPINLIGAHSNQVSDIEAQKFNIFIKLLQKISFYSSKFPLETALIYAIDSINQKDLKILNIENFLYNFKSDSLNNMIDTLSFQMNSKQISIIMKYLLSIYEENPDQSAFFFQKLFELLNFHFDISKNQEILIKSTRSKKKLYKLLLSFILSFLSVIAYRIVLIYQIYNILFTNEQNNLKTVHFNYFIIISFLFLLISIYFLNKIETSKILTLFDVLTVIFYFVNVYLAIYFISGVL